MMCGGSLLSFWMRENALKWAQIGEFEAVNQQARTGEINNAKKIRNLSSYMFFMRFLLWS